MAVAEIIIGPRHASDMIQIVGMSGEIIGGGIVAGPHPETVVEIIGDRKVATTGKETTGGVKQTMTRTEDEAGLKGEVHHRRIAGASLPIKKLNRRILSQIISRESWISQIVSSCTCRDLNNEVSPRQAPLHLSPQNPRHLRLAATVKEIAVVTIGDDHHRLPGDINRIEGVGVGQGTAARQKRNMRK